MVDQFWVALLSDSFLVIWVVLSLIGQVVEGLDHGIITMKKGECALFTVPPELGYRFVGRDGVPPNTGVLFEVELIAWIPVVNVSKDGGIIKKIMEKGENIECPGDLDEVLGISTA